MQLSGRMFAYHYQDLKGSYEPGVVAHACNPRILEVGGKRINSKPASFS